jgi:hypothetical protein
MNAKFVLIRVVLETSVTIMEEVVSIRVLPR